MIHTPKAGDFPHFLALIAVHENRSLRFCIAWDAVVCYWTTLPEPGKPARTSLDLVNALIGAQEGPLHSRLKRPEIVRLINDAQAFLGMAVNMQLKAQG